MRLFEWIDCESILHRLLIWDSPAWKLTENNTCDSNNSSVSLSKNVHFVLFSSIWWPFAKTRYLSFLRTFFSLNVQSPKCLFRDVTGQFGMHAGAKHGGGETASHCGRDEGPLQCRKRAEILLHSNVLHCFKLHWPTSPLSTFLNNGL